MISITKGGPDATRDIPETEYKDWFTFDAGTESDAGCGVMKYKLELLDGGDLSVE